MTSARRNEPERAALVSQLKAKIAELDAIIASPESILPKLEVGQGIVRDTGVRKSVAYRISAVSGDTITLNDVRNPAETRVVNRAELLAMVGGRSYQVYTHASLSASAPVPSLRHEATAVRDTFSETSRLIEMMPKLSPKSFRIFLELENRQRQLVQLLAQQSTGLDAYLAEHRQVRIWKMLTALSNPSTFFAKWDDPEARGYGQAPQRRTIRTTKAAIAEIERAKASLLETQRIDFMPVADGVTLALRNWSHSAEARPSSGERVAFGLAEIQAALDCGDVAGAAVAHRAAVLPYLELREEKAASLHRDASGAPSWLFAINTTLMRHRDARTGELILTSAELARSHDFVRDHWTEIVHQHDAMGAGGISAPGEVLPFDERTFQREIQRVRAIEQGSLHRELLPMTQSANAYGMRVRAAEPGLASKTGQFLADVVDAPDTWVVLGLTAGMGALGESAAVTARALQTIHTAREAGLGARAAMTLVRGLTPFALQNGVYGVLIHSGTLAFDIVIGDPERADLSVLGYAQAIVMMGTSELLAGAHGIRAKALADTLRARAVEQTRWFVEEAVATATITGAASAVRGDDLRQNLIANTQIALAMRGAGLVRAAMKPTPKPKPDPGLRYSGTSGDHAVKLWDDGRILVGDTEFPTLFHDREYGHVVYAKGDGAFGSAKLGADGQVHLVEVAPGQVLDTVGNPGGRALSLGFDAAGRSLRADGWTVWRSDGAYGVLPPDGSIGLSQPIAKGQDNTPEAHQALATPPLRLTLDASSTLFPGRDIVVTTDPHGPNFAIAPDGRLLRLNGGPERPWVHTADGIFELMDGAFRSASKPALTRTIDGRLLRFIPDASGVHIGFDADDVPRARFGPTMTPITDAPGHVRIVEPLGSPKVAVQNLDGVDNLYRVIDDKTVRGADGELALMRVKPADELFAGLDESGLLALLGRSEPKPKELVRNGISGTAVFFDGGRYEFGKTVEVDGRRLIFVSKTGGKGPSFRLLDVEAGALRDVLGACPTKTVLRDRSGDAALMIDDGEVYAIKHAPAPSLENALIGMAIELQNSPAGSRLGKARRIAQTAVVRDDFYYAQRLGALNNDSVTDVSVGHPPAPDRSGDLRIYVRDRGQLRLATRKEVEKRFDAYVPRGTAPPSTLRGEFHAEADGTRLVLVAPKGARQTIAIKLDPGVTPGADGFMSIETLVAFLNAQPLRAQRLVREIRFTRSDQALAAYHFETRTLELHATHGGAQEAVVVTHELAGHGTEADDSAVHRAILLARWLDGVGTQRSYGATNVNESYAVGIEEVVYNLHTAQRTPYFSRLASHVLQDENAIGLPRTKELIAALVLASAVAAVIADTRSR